MSKRAVEPQDIPDDAELTQYGENSPGRGANFRDRTRAEIGETDVSLILGRVDALAAATLITKARQPWASVRYSTAGALRTNGFTVRHTPSRENRLHVSVLAPAQGGDPVDWDDDLAKTFDGCFTEPQGGGNRA